MTIRTEDRSWRSIGRDERSEVIRLAAQGRQHPDAAIAEAASRWSHEPRWDRLSNRLPGWLLPAVALAFIAVALATALPVPFVIGGAVAAACGLLGWAATSTARRVRAVSDSAPAGPQHEPFDSAPAGL